MIDKNSLARNSTAARRKIWKELKTRYVLDEQDPLFASFLAEWRRCRSEQERALTAYVLLALNDRLVADLGTDLLFPLLRRAPAFLRVADVRDFIDRGAKLHGEVNSWSEQTRTAVAQKYTASIRDFGLAEGKNKKMTVRPALYAAPTRLLIRALRLIGTREMDIVAASIFRLVGLETNEVIDALSALNREGALRFRMQADVIELTLSGDH